MGLQVGIRLYLYLYLGHAKLRLQLVHAMLYQVTQTPLILKVMSLIHILRWKIDKLLPHDIVTRKLWLV